jgi:hypothetical protein
VAGTAARDAAFVEAYISNGHNAGNSRHMVGDVGDEFAKLADDSRSRGTSLVLTWRSAR